MKIPTTAERLDVGDMRRRLGNNDALIAELLRLFLEGYPVQLAAIRAAVEARQLDTVRRSAHMLKGGASNLSATGTVEAAARLEEAAERGETSELDRHFTQLVFEAEQLVVEVRRLTTGV